MRRSRYQKHPTGVGGNLGARGVLGPRGGQPSPRPQRVPSEDQRPTIRLLNWCEFFLSARSSSDSSCASTAACRKKYVSQACDSADLADRPRGRGAPGCECGVARPSVKGQPVNQSILHAWHQPSHLPTQHCENIAVITQDLRGRSLLYEFPSLPS